MNVRNVRCGRINTIWCIADVTDAPLIQGIGEDIDVAILRIGYTYYFRSGAWDAVVLMSGVGVNTHRGVFDHEIALPQNIPWIWDVVRENLPVHYLRG